jgi:hypothetical protein
MTKREKLVRDNLTEALQLLLYKASFADTAKDNSTDFAMWHSRSASDIGEILTTAREALRYSSGKFLGYDGKTFVVGARVELCPGTDLWMSGATHGMVVRASNTDLNKVYVKMDHPDVKKLVLATEDRLKRA